MVGEPVQQCAGQTFRAEYLGPFVERQVGGHQSGAALVTLAEHLEQQFGAGFTERNKAESVELYSCQLRTIARGSFFREGRAR